MKIAIKHIYIWALLAMLAGFSACSSSIEDEETADGSGKTVSVTLSISTDSPATRATGDPEWTDGTTAENMYSWVVVITDQTNVIKKVVSSTTALDDVESDEVKVELAEGSYYFYSFANISTTDLGNPTVGQTVSYETMAFTVNGNGLDVSSNHIPMSNKQTASVTEDGQTVNLWVVRMLAKMELQITNSSGSDVQLNSVSLSDVTSNATDNLYLMPNAIEGEDKIACTPNIVPTASKAEYTYTLTTPQSIANEATEKVTFYINESVASNPSYFVLSLNTTTSGETKSSTSRYAMLEWNQIARNDYRIIPITLDDYKVEFDVQQFTSIGTLPEVTLANGTLNITFANYGEFHIIPTVKKISTGETVAYGSWSLSEPDGYSGYFPIISTSGEFAYATAPTWSSDLKLFEGSIAPYDGYAIHLMNITLPSNRTMAVRTQVNMSYSDESATRADESRQWHTVHVSE
ncbi:MAG: hypothetical protein Q4D41_10800 [Prevotellaceae bacterium]|nr:hypothetical protein [Prevotellaceae bacterium]